MRRLKRGPKKIARSVTIYRDSYGVPHVYGPTDASCVFGYIYAQAEDNFWQIEDSYIRSLGRASEVYGDRTLADDMSTGRSRFPGSARAEYDRRQAARASLARCACGRARTIYLRETPRSNRGSSLALSRGTPPRFSRLSLYQLFIYGKSGCKGRYSRRQCERSNPRAQGRLQHAYRSTFRSTALDDHESRAAHHRLEYVDRYPVQKPPAIRACMLSILISPSFGPGQWYEGHVHSEEGWDMARRVDYSARLPRPSGTTGISGGATR